MSSIKTPEYYMEIAKGNVPGESLVHKFGRNPSVGTSFVPVAIGGVYPTPQASGAAAMRVKSGGNANDTAAGTGAREITIEGLDETGALASEAVATAGASASSATTTTFMRVFRVYVSASGNYATQSAGSHSGDIVIENTGGTEYATIASTDFPRGQSQIAAYSVPLGYTAKMCGIIINVDSNKDLDAVLFKRESILDVAAPYSAMRTVAEFDAISGEFAITFAQPLDFPALTDIGVMAKASTGTAEVTVDFPIVLIKD